LEGRKVKEIRIAARHMAVIDEYDDDNLVVMPGKHGKPNNTLS
jgi:hypothetical protein